MPSGNGLLVLTSPINSLVSKFQAALPQVLQKSSEKVYVHLLPGVTGWPPTSPKTHHEIVSRIYSVSSSINPFVDIRVILNGIKPNLHLLNFKFLHPISRVYFESKCENNVIQGYLNGLPSNIKVVKELLSELPEDIEDYNYEHNNRLETYENVVLGGTFDRIHNGHKILLSESILRAKKSVTIGVTNESMLKSKTLKELIYPVEQRISDVTDVCRDMDHTLKYDIVPISDPFGPSITNPNLDLIVGSEETKKGCLKINEKRLGNGFKECLIHVIPIISETDKQVDMEEDKVSSSSSRLRLLGKTLKDPGECFTAPYIIGLTGGSCSGKSHIAKYLESKYKVGIVDCDQLAHSAYLKGTDCFNRVVEAFGPEVVDPETGEINRRVLGAKVFADNTNLHKLESLVWPAIRQMADEQISEFRKDGTKIVVLDAAVLIPAGWETGCNQVWVAMVPEEEAVKRIMKRDNKSEEEAMNRLKSQMKFNSMMPKAHAVFCSLWEKENTQKQVDRAMDNIFKKYLKF